MQSKNMKKLAAYGKSKTPIEDTIRVNLQQIVELAKKGHSRAQIWKALEKDKFFVGSREGFRLALARVKQADETSIADIFSRFAATRNASAVTTADAKPTGGQCLPVPASECSDVSHAEVYRDQTAVRQNADAASKNASQVSTFVDPRHTSDY
jgi:hypothetical protein